jgi:hypothetical protein
MSVRPSHPIRVSPELAAKIADWMATPSRRTLRHTRPMLVVIKGGRRT